MQLKFRDFYGQHVEIHNNTASGNIRLKVNTCKNLNEVKIKKIEECDTETDISLNYSQLKLLQSAIESILAENEED